MEIRFIVEKVLESLKCNVNCKNCPRKRLREFIEKIGVDEFAKLYEANKIPEDIANLFEEKAKSIIL